MVKITNGMIVTDVSNGAYESIFKGIGYTIIKEGSEGMKKSKAKELTEDEKFISEITEKPISEWVKEEVKKFAEIKKIDISGTKSINEAKAIIKNFLDA